MEEKKKFDVNALIGFILIGGIILYMLNTNQSETTDKEEKPTVEESISTTENSTEKPKDTADFSTQDSTKAVADSTILAQKHEELGAFAYSAGLPSAKEETTIIENEVLRIKVNNKGGEIEEVMLKEINSSKDSLPVKIIHNDNASLYLDLLTSDNKRLNTKNLYFEPTLTKSGDSDRLSMKLKVAEDQFLEYIYTLKPDDYMMDFSIRSQGLSNVFNHAAPIELNWELKAYRDGKSISYENRYTESVWQYEDKKTKTQQASKTKENDSKDISWVAYRQHFFSSILLNNSAFKEGKIRSENLVKDEDIDTVFTKSFASTFPLQLNKIGRAH